MRSRNKVVNLATSWLGLKESDGSFKKIINIYNSHKPLPRGLKMRVNWSWCACTWSALAISLGYTDIMPIEISCGELINMAKKMGIWVEKDSYVPSPGDAILYDWDDNGKGDSKGWPDHVGVVTYVNKKSGYITVIEGNYSNAVKKRTISINGKFIRGYITPKYSKTIIKTPEKKEPDKDLATVAREVISGVWGSGDKRKKNLEKKGYDYNKVQEKVNEILNGDVNKKTTKKITTTCRPKSNKASLSGTYVTTDDLYCRNDAGSNKKALCLIPKGTKVHNYGNYTTFNKVKWLLVQVELDGVQYTGFCSSTYLKKR